MSSAQSVINHHVQVLYSEHHNWLKGWLSQRLGNSTEAADLTQDTFLRLLGFPSSRHFSSSDQARSYLRAIRKKPRPQQKGRWPCWKPWKKLI